MKKNIFFIFLVTVTIVKAQDCTEESVQHEPGRFLDAHTGKGLSTAGYTPAEIANARKILSAFEGVCKKDLVFTGGQAKAGFMLDTKGHYDQLTAGSYTYNLGFHQFVCNVQTHQLRIVDEYQNVLRVTANPGFTGAFPFLDLNAPVYRNPVNSKDPYAPYIDIFNYYAFGDATIVDLINKGNRFLDLNNEYIGVPGDRVLENKPGKGYGYAAGNNFLTLGNDYVYRQWYLTHSDIPFFIPVSRKKFLRDLLAFYDREKAYRTAAFAKDKEEIIQINEKKKGYVQDLLNTKDTGWLNQPAAVERDNKTFTVPYDRTRYLGDIYGNFYFKEFYTGNDGLKLYCINPAYLKKYPPNGPRPSLIKVMYRFKTKDAFTLDVRDTYINKLDMEGIKKLLD